jgi:hypothetical protein
MNPTAWIALGALAFNALILAIGYGVLKGTVAALENRVRSLEAEIGTLNELKVTVAEVKTSLGFLVEQFKDLNASIRWMREPAPTAPTRARSPK